MFMRFRQFVQNIDSQVRVQITLLFIFVSLLINFMLRNYDRIPFSSIELVEAPLSPVKTNIKILKQKLPADFFTKRHGIYSSTSVVRSNTQRQPPATSNFPRKTIREQSPARDILTARDYPSNKDEDLIMGVLKSAREMKRVFRKHSIQLRKQRLPVRKTNQFDIELPPLLLKKGVTSVF